MEQNANYKEQNVAKIYQKGVFFGSIVFHENTSNSPSLDHKEQNYFGPN